MGVGDHWWRVDATTDVQALGEDVAAAWVNHARPWLEARATIAGAAACPPDSNPWNRPGLLLLLGCREDAQHLLDAVVESWPEARRGIARDLADAMLRRAGG